MNQTLLEKYADLLVMSGLHVKPGQLVVVRAPIEAYELVRLVTKKAFKQGAKDVVVKYNDEEVTHEHYLHADPSCFESVPTYESAFYNETAKDGACYLSLIGEDPDLMKDVDPKRMSSYQAQLKNATQFYRNALDTMESQWCIAAVSTKKWAKKIYNTQDAKERLWEDIFKVSRVDEQDPNENWEKHRLSFEHKVKILNDLKISSLHYTNALGTDLTVELPEGYVFCGGGSYLKDGTYYFANIPTEEIFSMPLKNGVNGKLFSSMPLSHHGALVEDFWFTFKDGKVVDYDAKNGRDVLTSILETDEGSKYLGEVALVPYGSPISLMNQQFFNTLIDENASCHFALGQSYNECIEGGLEMDKDQLLEKGANQSLSHVDFMVGTQDLSITALTHDGKEVPIFEQGRFSSLFD